MQATTRIVAIVYVLLAAFAVVAIELRIVLIPAACASLLLAAGGMIVFRPLRGAFFLPWPAVKDTTQDLPPVVIAGTPLSFQGYEQELVVTVGVRHFLELVACTLLAAVALYVMTVSSVAREDQDSLRIGGLQAEFICAAGLAVVLLSLRWFMERRALRYSHYTIGTILGRDPGFFRRGITYQFRDSKGERRGGRGPLHVADNAVLVLYNSNDPDTSLVSGSLLFHRFTVALIPARHRQAASS